MKILIADDDRVSLLVLKGALQDWDYDVLPVGDGEAAWDALQKADRPAMAILDWDMPGMDGVEVCRRVRLESPSPYVYLIVLTSKRETEFIVQAMDAGADDFIAKPFQIEELQVRVRAGRRIAELHHELQQRALTDALTCVWNRGAIMQALVRELARRLRAADSAAVALIDIDHFKRINDTHGHAAGDAVLQEVARRIATGLRPPDIFGRYGGEEFLFILPQCGQAEAIQVAERVRQCVSATTVEGAFGQVQITISIGVASISASSQESANGLLERADAALYAAKRAGRDRVTAAKLDLSLA